MKKLLLFLFPAILFSCGEPEKTQEEIIADKASIAIKENMNDPESYEFVSVDKIDTIVWSEKESKALLGKALLTGKESRPAFNDSVQEVIKQRKAADQFHFYDVSMTIRGKNSFGAKVLADYYVKFDKEYNVLEVNQRD